MDWMLTAMQVAALTVAGMCHALLGSVKVPLAKKLKIDEARVGGLVSVFGFTLIPMVLAFGFLVDALGKQAVLGGGFVLLIISLILLARLKSYPLALVAVLLLGTGWSALVNVLNVTSAPAFLPPLPPDELKTRMSYAMNMGDFVFGMGAFLTPLLVVALLRKFSLSTTLLVLAAFAIVPVLLGLGVNWGSPQLNPKELETVAGGLTKLLTDPLVWLCCLAFFFHVPIEASVATWATTLMSERGVKEGVAATLLSVFWLTFMGSRLATALLLHRVVDAWNSLVGRLGETVSAVLLIPKELDTLLVICMAVLCIVFTLGIVLSRSAWLTCLLLVLAGCILGPIFPTLIAILLSHQPENLYGRAVGIFFCIGGIGWTTIPIMIGAYAKRTSVQRAFLIANASAVVLTVLAVVLRWFV